DRVVDLAVLELGQAIVVIALEQYADERMQEVEVFGCWLERKRVDRVSSTAQAQFEVVPSEQRRQLAVAAAQIEDDGERVVLLRVRREEVDEEALPAAGRPQHEGVSDVFDVEIEGVGRVMWRLEYRERIAAKVTADALAGVEREQEAQIRGVRLEDGEST